MLAIIPPSDTPLKRCSTCPEGQQWHPITDFSTDRSTSDNLDYRCKECKRANRRVGKPQSIIVEGYKRCLSCPDDNQWHPATSEYWYAKKGGHGSFRSTCIQCHKAANAEHRKETRQYNHQRYIEHREEHLRNQLQYEAEHREEINQYQLQYRATHKEKIHEKDKRYRQTESGRLIRRTIEHKRNARKKKVDGTLTPQQIQDKLKAQRYCCYYAACGHAKFEKKDGKYIYHIEHTVPVSRSEANPRHDINYVVLSCPSCNFKKRNRLPHEFPEGGRLF